LTDDPRPGQPRRIIDARVEEVIVKPLETTPRGRDVLVDAGDGHSSRPDANGGVADLEGLRSARSLLIENRQQQHPVRAGHPSIGFREHQVIRVGGVVQSVPVRNGLFVTPTDAPPRTVRI
jgi:hypothetical protein